ncbi:MAG TPA: GNAT family N-acetyltransferase [Kofleriaceae bacterium]|nr:GNAT family N-acetyltransferase [Kofleriaceae bacterium]
MFVDAALAARIDRVEAQMCTAIARTVRDPDARMLVLDVGGGAAVFAGAGAPVNKLIGLGFAPLDTTALAAALDEVEAAWQARGEPVRVELATVAEPDAAALLSARGYQLVGFEHVLVRRLDALPEPVAGIAVERVSDPADWMRIAVDGFATPDGTGAPVDDFDRGALERVMKSFAHTPGFSRYVASLDGERVGAASMRVDDGIALLAGATTLPAARRRGVQRALLATRLRDAREAGAELAFVVTAPGSLSQHNIVRSGFEVGYVRAILVLPVKES